MVDNNPIDSQIEDNQARIVGVSSKEFSAKYRSKKEIFNFLAVLHLLTTLRKCHYLFFEGINEWIKVNYLNQENKNNSHSTVSTRSLVNSNFLSNFLY